MSIFSHPVKMNEYSEFEQRLILTWAQSHYMDFLAKNPESTGKERTNEFLDALEGSLYVVTEFRKRFAD